MTALHLLRGDEDDCSESSRGVLASLFRMTPARSDDATKLRITLRDFIVAAIAIAGMWGLQVATQERAQGQTTAAIQTLGTKFDGYVQKQTEANTEFQRQLDAVARRAELGVVTGNHAVEEAARLQGILMGAGIKGAK